MTLLLVKRTSIWSSKLFLLHKFDPFLTRCQLYVGYSCVNSKYGFVENGITRKMCVIILREAKQNCFHCSKRSVLMPCQYISIHRTFVSANLLFLWRGTRDISGSFCRKENYEVIHKCGLPVSSVTINN